MSDSVFIDQLQTKLKPLNDLIDELHDIGLQSYIELPTIVVVGEQSTGIYFLFSFSIIKTLPLNLFLF